MPATSKTARKSSAAPKRTTPAKRGGATSGMKDTAIRPDFVPKDAYLSAEFTRLENERLWPKVWQIACRLEEIPKVGDYVTYEVAGE